MSPHYGDDLRFVICLNTLSYKKKKKEFVIKIKPWEIGKLHTHITLSICIFFLLICSNPKNNEKPYHMGAHKINT